MILVYLYRCAMERLTRKSWNATKIEFAGFGIVTVCMYINEYNYSITHTCFVCVRAFMDVCIYMSCLYT